MGQTSVYVFSLSDRPGFAQKSLALLIEAGVISSEPYPGFCGPGAAPWASGAFDYLGVHQSPLPFIIPQDPAIDWRNVKVACSHCLQKFPITALKDRVGVFCAREYLYFSDVEAGNLPDFEMQIRKVLPDAEVKSYWYT